jgi:hypothetical protein
MSDETSGLTRRDVIKVGTAASLAGYAVGVEKVLAQAIKTDTDGITAGDAEVAIGSYNMPVYEARPASGGPAPIVVCIVGDDGIAAAFAETVRGQNISGHALEVSRSLDSTAWRSCHLLFVADRETRQFTAAKGGIKGQPVLTVSDGKGFAHAGGVIELFIEGGRMRFAINLDAMEQTGVHLSSRLLGLAKVVRSPHDQ